MDWNKWIPWRKKTPQKNYSVIPPDTETVSPDLDALNFPPPPDVAAVIDREKTEREVKLLDAQIKNLETENLTHKLEVEAKIANDIRWTELRQKRLDLKAEQIKREQDRLDATAAKMTELTQFKFEQEELRKLNEQAFAQAKERQEQKAKLRVEQFVVKARQRKLNRRLKRIRRGKLKEILLAGTKRTRSVVVSKKFMIFLAIAALLALVSWLFQAGYLSVWLDQVLVWISQAWTGLTDLWQYRWYGLGVAILAAALWSLKSQTIRDTVITKSKDVTEALKTWLTGLKIATSVLVIIGLSVITLIGISLHSVFITLSAIALMPLFVGRKSQYSLYFRLTFVVFTIGIVFMLSQVHLR